MSSQTAASKDVRVAEIINLLIQLASGNLEARGRQSELCDELDAIIGGINMFAEELLFKQHSISEAMEELESAHDASLSIMEDMDIQRVQLIKEIEMRKAAEEEIRRVNKELNDFAYIVSHDLKAPLRAISTITAWLAEDYKDKFDDAGREQLNILLNRTQRMHSMIEGILQYSRAGRATGALQKVESGKIVRRVIDSLMPPKNIKIVVQEEMPEVFLEPVKLSQIFQNLISNAVKYMDKPEGMIEIGCIDKGKHCEFFVKDNGPGIEERNFERIFQLFQALKPKNEFESTGIGLSIVKKIIEQEGGSVWVESEIGKGSVFRFTLLKKEVQ